MWISPRISLKFVPKVRINNIPALVQIMAWCRPGDKPLSEPMMASLLAHICVTQPHWVKRATQPFGTWFILLFRDYNKQVSWCRHLLSRKSNSFNFYCNEAKRLTMFISSVEKTHFGQNICSVQQLYLKITHLPEVEVMSGDSRFLFYFLSGTHPWPGCWGFRMWLVFKNIQKKILKPPTETRISVIIELGNILFLRCTNTF